MDVHCSSCGEPWDTHHLRHDAIWETCLGEGEIAEWKRMPEAARLSERFRGALKVIGYVFGRSILNVIHCPACPTGARPDPVTAALKAELELALEGDPDVLANSYEDLGL